MRVVSLKTFEIFLAIALHTTASAQSNSSRPHVHADHPPITLEQVITRTLLTNPTIQARYHELQAAREGQRITRGKFRPQINAQGYLAKTWQSHLPRAGFAQGYQPGYQFELRQLLFDGFRTSHDFKQAGFEKLSRFYEFLATTDDLAFEAAKAYLDVERRRALEALAQDNYRLHERTLKHLQQRADSGVGRRVDGEQASGRLALAQVNLMTESANLNDVIQRFLRITGLDVPASLAPIPDVTPHIPQSPRHFHESLRNNPSFLSKQAQLYAAELAVRTAKGSFAPKLEFVATTGTDSRQLGPEFKPAHHTTVQLVMSYNLYRGGADTAQLRQAINQSYAAQDIRNHTCRNTQQELATTLNNITHLRLSLPFLHRHDAATAKVRRAYQQQFQIGQRSLLDLLDTENELFEARRAVTNATIDLQIAQYRWLALSHRLLSTLGLAPAHHDAPEEAHRLKVSDDVMQRCHMPLADTSRLQPVKLRWRQGTLPPILVPDTTPASHAPPPFTP